MGHVSRTDNFGAAGRKILIAALLATTAIAGGAVAFPGDAFAQAQTSFNIPAGPLNQALATFGRQSGTQLSYEASIASGKRSPGIQGAATREQAIARLLQGSELNYSFKDARNILITQPGASPVGSAPAGAVLLDPVNVQGASNPNSTMTPMPAYAGGQVATGGQVGMLGNRSVMNTPFSQTNYTNKTIQDQQARTVQEVLTNDPSILTKQNNATDEDGSITIRGFSNTLSTGVGSLNGLAGMAPLRTPEMDYIERVEVLKGPSALLNGMAAAGQGGIGGSYNLVTKQAGDEPLTELTARFSSRAQPGAHIDVARRFGVNKEYGIRFNGAYRDGDAPVKPVSEEVGTAALNLDYRGERVRIAADVAHQSHNANPQNVQQIVLSGVGGPPAFAFVPNAPDAGTSLNPVWSSQPSVLTLGMVRGEVDITDNVTAYGAIGKQKLDFSLIGPNQPRLTNPDGTYGWSNVEHTNFAYDVTSVQGGFRGKATTGPVKHLVSLNVSQTTMETGEAQKTTPFTYTTNIYNPVFGTEVSAGDPGVPRKTSDTRASSIGVADTLSILDERVQFTAGIRYQTVEASSFNTTTGAMTSTYTGKAWTPAVGLVVKPWENVSVYANYIESLQRGIIVGSSFSNEGEILAPYVSKQYETGVKVDWGTVTTTLALFQIAQPNVIQIAGTPENRQALDGELRNRGIELNAYGEITAGVRLMGGITLIDSEQTKTQDGLTDGYREAGVPIIRTVVGGEWDTPFLRGFTLTGRVTYTGDQMISSSSNTLKIPSWEVVDLGARYAFESPWNNKPVTVRFNVDNVFDKDYWSAANFRYVQLGAPRTFRLSATIGF